MDLPAREERLDPVAENLLEELVESLNDWAKVPEDGERRQTGNGCSHFNP